MCCFLAGWRNGGTFCDDAAGEAFICYILHNSWAASASIDSAEDIFFKKENV